jgi:hypothetical protein
LILKSNIIMKKVRIMLAAIAVLGVVGGALAFKANRSPNAYCYGPINTTVCTTSAPAGFTARDGAAIHYVTTVAPASCNGFTKCTIPALTVEDE